MNARLHGFLEFLDLLAEGDRRRAELIAGRSCSRRSSPPGS